MGVPGADALAWAGGIVLPLGISFYTFQSLSYTIDVYRGEIEPTRRFLDFAAYVAMFPQLVAGPIVRFLAACGSPCATGAKRGRSFRRGSASW